MLWLAAYLTGFPPVGLHTLRWTHGLAPMWSGLYLISTRVNSRKVTRFDECQCPLGLIPHFYNLFNDAAVNNYGVSMPSRAYTSFLRYPFKNLGFMRFPEPVFAGIYQNILTTAVFRAC